MRRDVGRHADSDTCGSVDQQIRDSCGKYGGFLFRFIKVGYEFNRILVDIGQHLHGDLAETGFGVTHCGSAVSVDRSEVSVSVHKGIMS